MHVDDSADKELTIDDLIESFMGRLRAGEPVTVDAYQQRYPEFADEIAVVFPPLQMLEQCRPGSDPEAAPFVADGDDTPTRLGEYRILREIGRGGMGIVYEAEHDAMRRRVALKVLPKQMAARAANLARFQREARSAGQMHHSNIVPVFEVGEDDGYHFYAMQFIRGQSLEFVIEEMQALRDSGAGRPTAFHAREKPESTIAADAPVSPAMSEETLALRLVSESPDSSVAAPPDGELLADLRSPQSGTGNVFDSTEWNNNARGRGAFFRRAAAIGMQVADALAYAHHNQMLHRDIKPSNLLLDTDGVVWVTDFGLAKGVDDDLTQSGDIVGTLRYMAPERFRGRTDASGDIYGLGITLYELCTLAAAYSATTRASLVEQITNQDPPAPRSIDPAIPRDLETIILKSIDRVPQRRYASAMQMAEDLQAFLGDRPVRARRISRVERLWRVCRRNPITAMLTAASFLLLMAIACGSTYFSLRIGQQAEALKTENQRAVAAELDARTAAYHASVGQARSLRQGRLPGQHFDALAAVRRAMVNLDYLQMEDPQRSAEQWVLRTEAAAALSLTDLSPIREFARPDTRWWSISVSPDRQWFAQPNDEGEIVIAEVDTNQEKYRLPPIGDPVWVTRFGRDAQHLIAIYTADPYRMVIWRLEDATRVLEFTGHGLDKFDFNLEDEAVLVQQNRLIRLRVGVPEPVGSITMTTAEERPRCEAIASHPSERLVALALDVQQLNTEEGDSGTTTVGRLLIVDLESEKIQQLKLPERVGAIAWTGVGNQLAIGYQTGPCEIRDPSQPEKILRRFEGHTSRVTIIRSSADGRTMMTKAWDGSLRVWDMASQQQITRLNGYQVLTTTDTKFDQRTALWRNGAAQLWTVHQGQVRSNEEAGAPINRGCNRLAVAHPSVEALTFVSTEEGFEIWDIAKGRRLASITRTLPTGLDLIENGETLVTCGESGVEYWPIRVTRADGTHVEIGPPERVSSESLGKTAFYDRETWATITAFDRAKIFTPNADVPHEIEHRRISSFRFSPHGEWLATRTWHGLGIKIWDVASGELVVHLIPQASSPRCAFTPDSKYLVANTRSERIVWRTDGWKVLHHQQREEPDGWPGRVEIAPDNRTALLNHSRNRLELFDLLAGRSMVALEPSDVSPRDAACFSCDGGALLSFGGDSLEFWDIRKLRAQLSELGLDWNPPGNGKSAPPAIVVNVLDDNA